jgi:hypothetical protein
LLYSVKKRGGVQIGCREEFELETYDDERGGCVHRTSERRGPTDGGWGWVVVGCSLMISLIQDGVSYSFGLIYVELLKEFQASKSKTSWVNSLFLAVPLLGGPLASLMVQKFGCRWMTILGGLLGATGFVLSATIGTHVHIFRLFRDTFNLL